MKLQTQIPLEKQSDNLIDYNSNLLLLGSCFVENIGDQFDYFKFKNRRNPFGVLFHPKAIETLVTNAVKGNQYSEEDVFFHNEQWHCYDAHTHLSHSSKERLLQNLNDAIQLTNQQLQSASHIMITLGTSWVYQLNSSKQIVANCHKVPNNHFTKVLLSIQEISDALQNLVANIRHINPNARFIFTVSPVRHIKDGFVENTLSKAHLIAAIHQVLSHRAQTRCYYFPSYELMMDELRDYRFYADDMLHPNQTAVDYIWQKFQEVWVSDSVLRTMTDVDEIQKGLLHRPFNPNSKAHQQFQQKLSVKMENLQLQFPHISF